MSLFKGRSSKNKTLVWGGNLPYIRYSVLTLFTLHLMFIIIIHNVTYLICKQNLS